MNTSEQLAVVNETKEKSAIVNSHNEWDPLEEVIVGRLDNATMPGMHVSIKSVAPPEMLPYIRLIGSRKYPKFLLKKAQYELDNFKERLKRKVSLSESLA